MSLLLWLTLTDHHCPLQPKYPHASLLRHVCGLLGAGGTRFTDMRATLASALFQSPQLPFAHVTHSHLLLGASMGQALSGGITVKWLMNSILPQCPPDTWEIPPSLSCQREEDQTVPLLSLSNSLSPAHYQWWPSASMLHTYPTRK